MEKAKVYFTDFRSTNGIDMPSKLKKLIRMAGIDKIDFEGKFVAIKIHFGEPGNVSFIRPNYAKAVADVVRELGGKPFLTDCNTLYPGYRRNALDHIDAAQLNGFNEMLSRRRPGPLRALDAVVIYGPCLDEYERKELYSQYRFHRGA